MNDIHELEKKIIEELYKLEVRVIKDAVDKHLGRLATEGDYAKCQKRYRTHGDEINYGRYQLYYDFHLLGTVEHVFPAPFSSSDLKRTIKIVFTPAP